MLAFPIERSGLATHQSPQNGVLSYLPVSWVPFAQLMRLEKPVGVMNIYFPYLFGTLYAACVAQPTLKVNSFLVANLKLFAAAFILRSAGCTWNDIIDRDLDRQVARCRLRPMARGAVSLRNGYIFTGAQCLVWLSILSQTCEQYLFYAAPLILMVGFYPFAKRLTDYAQVVLGFTLAWGVLIGCCVVGLDPMMLPAKQSLSTGVGLLCLYMSYVVWTIIHDTIYAHQDIQDDVKAGIKSMAVRYKYQTRSLLSGLGVGQLGLLILTGMLMDASTVYFLGACIGTSALLVWMIWQVDLSDPRHCLWWFQNGCLIVGGTTFAGLFGEYLNRLAGQIFK